MDRSGLSGTGFLHSPGNSESQCSEGWSEAQREAAPAAASAFPYSRETCQEVDLMRPLEGVCSLWQYMGMGRDEDKGKLISVCPTLLFSVGNEKSNLVYDDVQ